MKAIDKELIKDSEVRFKLLQEMKSLKSEFKKEGYEEYAKKISQMIAEFQVKYGSDLII